MQHSVRMRQGVWEDEDGDGGGGCCDDEEEEKDEELSDVAPA